MKNEYKTKPRNRIIAYLKENPDKCFTARDIVAALAKDGTDVDRSTIYRNLDRLSREGSLIRYKEKDINASCFRYSEKHEDCHTHIHAQCEKCGRIFHLRNNLFENAAKEMQEEFGIDIDYGKTVLIGLCDTCKEHSE